MIQEGLSCLICLNGVRGQNGVKVSGVTISSSGYFWVFRVVLGLQSLLGPRGLLGLWGVGGLWGLFGLQRSKGSSQFKWSKGTG